MRRRRFIAVSGVIVLALATTIGLVKPWLKARQTTSRWMAVGAIVTCNNYGEVETLLALDGFDTALLSRLADSESMLYLVLADARISDHETTVLQTLKHLRSLGISRTAITDESIKNFAQLPRLETLVLDDTSITDASLPALEGMKHLKYLNIRRTLISACGWWSLRQKMPGTKVSWEARRANSVFRAGTNQGTRCASLETKRI